MSEASRVTIVVTCAVEGGSSIGIARRNGRAPFDWQLFNLQTMFLITGVTFIGNRNQRRTRLRLVPRGTELSA